MKLVGIRGCGKATRVAFIAREEKLRRKSNQQSVRTTEMNPSKKSGAYQTSSSSTSRLLRKQAVAPVLNVCGWCAPLWLGICKGWGLELFVFRAPPYVCCGGVLLSHTLPGAVPSALAGLASRFGMDAGRFPAAMTTTRWFNQYSLCPPCVGVVLVVIRIVATSILGCLSTIRCIRLWLKCLLVSAH